MFLLSDYPSLEMIQSDLNIHINILLPFQIGQYSERGVVMSC